MDSPILQEGSRFESDYELAIEIKNNNTIPKNLAFAQSACEGAFIKALASDWNRSVKKY